VTKQNILTFEIFIDKGNKKIEIFAIFKPLEAPLVLWEAIGEYNDLLYETILQKLCKN